MKNLKTNSMMALVMLLASFSFGSKAEAETKCMIALSKPCRTAPLPLYFQDGDRYANINAGRCIERAREYKAWCGNQPIEATSAFQVDGRNVIGGHTNPDGKTYVSDGVARFTNFKD